MRLRYVNWRSKERQQGGTLDLGRFHLGRTTRLGEAQGMENPVPSNSAKVPHQGFVLVRGDRSDCFVGPALNDNRVNTCMAEEAQGISDKAGQQHSQE